MENYRKTEQKTEAKGKPEDSTLKRVLDDLEEWEGYYRPYRQKHLGLWKLWNNERIKQQFTGDFDSFDPMTFQMTEGNVDNVYSSRPKVAFVPRNRYQETDTKILQGMWDRNWDDNNMDFYIPVMGREATNIGNMVSFDCWEDRPEGGYRKTEHIPFPDCILDAAAKDQWHIRKAGYRCLKRMEELKEARRYDREKSAWVPRYSHLEDVPMYGSGNPQLDGQLKAMLAGSTLADQGMKGQVEIVYMIYLDKIVEVANRKVVIYEGPNPYHRESYEVEVQDQDDEGDKLYDENSVTPEMADAVQFGTVSPEELAAQLAPTTKKITVPEIMPFIPIAMHTGYKDGSLLIAKGEVEPYADTQEDLNDSINMMKEDIAHNVQGVKITDRTRVQPDEEEQLARAQSGSVVAVTGGVDAVGTLSHNAMDSATQFEITREKQSIRDTARIDEVIQGVSDNQEKTATEINAQVAQANGGFRTKTTNLESGYYKQQAENYVKFLQIFMPNQDEMVRVNGLSGVEFVMYSPSQYWGLFDVKITLESNAQAKKTQEARNALNWYTTVAKGNPNFNAFEVDKYVSEKVFDLDDERLKLLMNPNPMNMAMMGGAPVGDVANGSPMTPAPMQPALPAGPMNA